MDATTFSLQSVMRRLLLLIPLTALLAFSPLPRHASFAITFAPNVSGTLKTKVMSLSDGNSSLCRNDLLCGPHAIYRFYENRFFTPAWTDEIGPRPQAHDLLDAVRGSDTHGLNPRDYHLEPIETIFDRIDTGAANDAPKPDLLAALDMLLTDAFLLYGSHLLSGRVDPQEVQPDWDIQGREKDLFAILPAGLKENRIPEVLEQLAPRHEGYQALKQGLRQYRTILESGGWGEVTPGPKMEMGYEGGRVAELRSRLMATGDLEPYPAVHRDRFDEVLNHAVRRFQKRHGLDPDGIVGSATLRALNAPTILRVEQIRANLERWRWLPQDLGVRHILVNIADFRLHMVENGDSLMQIRVVAGRPYRTTPVFSGTMTYLEINPYWHIPPTIARKDILPKVRQDPDYLTERGIRVFENWKPDAEELDPWSIDWSKVTSRNFSYKLRQDPGPLNALGRIKFMFPNKFDVYLHDTPAKGLFEKTQRTFSSGCVRVEKPLELAAFVLDGDSAWTPETIRAAIESGKTQIVRLPRPLPVHLLYWTAWADETDGIQFREDVYGRDKRLREALNQPPPGVSIEVPFHRPW